MLEDTPVPPQNDDPLFRTEGVQGTCRVMCFHPKSNVTIALMTVNDIVTVITRYNLYNIFNFEHCRETIFLYTKKNYFFRISSKSIETGKTSRIPSEDWFIFYYYHYILLRDDGLVQGSIV